MIIDPEYLFETVNVETQQKNPSLAVVVDEAPGGATATLGRFGRGSIELSAPENPKILAFMREYDGQCVLVIANMSRFVQFVELDLSRFAGLEPIEMFGQTRFPRIGNTPYVLSLAPHAFFWFTLHLETAEAAATTTGVAELPRLTLSAGPLEISRACACGARSRSCSRANYPSGAGSRGAKRDPVGQDHRLDSIGPRERSRRRAFRSCASITSKASPRGTCCRWPAPGAPRPNAWRPSHPRR